jgi:hypothetical protein
MPDPMELAVVSSALPAVAAFIMARVDRLLGASGGQPEEDVTVPEALLGQLQLPLQPDQDRLRLSREHLALLREILTAQDGSPDASPLRLARHLAQARGLLEGIYGQHITFAGEDRPVSGPFVRQKITTLSGEATGMEADEITQSAHVDQDVKTVEAGAKLIGMKARRVGQ